MLMRLFLIVASISFCLAATDNECAWQNPTTKIWYDFSTFANSGVGYHFQYQDHGDTYEMYVTLCEALKTSPCQPKTSVCQEWDNGTGKKTIGKDEPKPSFAAKDATTVSMTVGNGEEDPTQGVCKKNNAIIDLICDTAVKDDPKFAYQKVDIANGLCTYMFSVTHVNSCAGGGGGISGGSILLIIGFCGFAVYCAIGAVYQFKVKEARGVEIIPNNSFWFQLPGLVKEGCRFVFFKLTGKSDYAPL